MAIRQSAQISLFYCIPNLPYRAIPKYKLAHPGVVTAKPTACLFTIQPVKHNRLSNPRLLETVQGGTIKNAGIILFACILIIDKLFTQENRVRKPILDIRIGQFRTLQAKGTVASLLFGGSLVPLVKIMSARGVSCTCDIVGNSTGKMLFFLHVSCLAGRAAITGIRRAGKKFCPKYPHFLGGIKIRRVLLPFTVDDILPQPGQQADHPSGLFIS